MRIAIDKYTSRRVFLENKNETPRKFNEAKWLWIAQLANEEWLCPFCGNEMIFKSFREENVQTPHWAAKTHHEEHCEVFERILDGSSTIKINYLKGIVGSAKEKYIEAAVMELSEFEGSVYEGAVFKFSQDDYEIKNTFVSQKGEEWATINVGNPFGEGISINIKKSDLPDHNEEVVICFDEFDYKTGSTNGREWSIRRALKNGFKYFIKRKDKFKFDNPHELDLMKHFVEGDKNE